MQNYAFVTTCAVVAVLMGCATKYAPPEDSPTAMLILSGSPRTISGGIPVSDARATMGRVIAYSLIQNQASCTDAIDLAHGIKQGGQERILIGANKPVVIKFNYVQFVPSTSCEGFMKFLPQKDAKYIIELDQNYFSQGKCIPKLFKNENSDIVFKEAVFEINACGK